MSDSERPRSGPDPEFPSGAPPLILDPVERSREKERKRLRYHQHQVPRLRLIGFLLLSAMVAFWNLAFGGASAGEDSLAFFAGVTFYSLFSWAVLLRWYARFSGFDLGDFFLGVDILFHILAIRFSGGPDSPLIILLVTRVADQANTRFRRVLVFGHLEILGYLGLLVYLRAVEGASVNWTGEAVKVFIVYTFNLYISLTALTAERQRNLNKTAIRRANEELALRRKTERELQDRNRSLRTALDEIKVLRGIVPICSFCKKIRDDQGYWNQLEAYIRDHSEAEFSHGICPECARRHYPDMAGDLD